ncbi:NAD(P)-dependent oxidoreductase [Amycolatopsis australiensis]|uniref:Putative NADH-flavin reductase n=1 Tax=Amycolatopsis australiensis TaxID=546364 RepID=A0A1K1R5S0_9PSEU|nr:NAD(P)H-binding protein [Amycolatopsis australiensis]SFW67365.1 Putative NADH-flavin reductase [Amycolatopsis australiensis]
MRVAVFGANGPTGRLLTSQAVEAGHPVTAVTRRPRDFPLRHDRLTVAEADVHDAGAVDQAMTRRGVRRLAVVTSSAVEPVAYPGAGVLFNRVLQPFVTRVLGKTVYDDMRRMEALVRESDVDWTIVRPSGLFDLPGVTDYELVEGHSDHRFTARADLAASLLRIAGDPTLAGKVVSVTTTQDTPSMLRLIRQEAFGKD